MEQPPTTSSSPSTSRTLSTSTTAFRLNSGQLFLTYPQCDLSPDQALALLRDKLDFESYIIAQEEHSETGLHLHVYLRRGAGKKWNIRNPNQLDLGPFHGNYQGCRNPTAVMRYCTKDGNYLANVDTTSKGGDSTWGSLISQARTGATTTTLLDLLTENPKTARDLVLHREAILKTIQALRPRPLTVSFALSDFKWTIPWDPKTVLILTGPTNSGKTALAKALLAPTPLLVTHFDDLKWWDPDLYSGLIYDEASLKHLPRETQIHHVDLEETRSVHARYCPALLTAGRKVIFTSNLAPDQILEWHDPAIKRRCTWVAVTCLNEYEKMYP